MFPKDASKAASVWTAQSRRDRHHLWGFTPRRRVVVVAGIKPGVVPAGVTGPTSQIPGLSHSADVKSPVERTSGRRVGIFETDSDYVKLAKSGGHKGKVLVPQFPSLCG